MCDSCKRQGDANNYCKFITKNIKTFNSLFNSTVKESLLLFYLQDHSTYVDKDVGSIGGVGKIKKFCEPFCRDISGEFLWQYSSHFIIHIDSHKYFPV